VLIWINGTFGVGKTQAAFGLHRKLPGSAVVDPELLGFGIQRMYPPAIRDDFQETPWWAPTAAEILVDISRKHPGTLIVPMTLTDPVRRRVMFDTLHRADIKTLHVTLLANQTTVLRRLRSRLDGRSSWAARRFADADAALRADPFGERLATDGMSVPQVVEHIGALAGVSLSHSLAERLAQPARRLGVTLRHIR
jgi:hypothetical protein